MQLLVSFILALVTMVTVVNFAFFAIWLNDPAKHRFGWGNGISGLFLATMIINLVFEITTGA